MPEFVHACVVNDIPDGGAHRVVVEGVPVAIVRSDGTLSNGMPPDLAACGEADRNVRTAAHRVRPPSTKMVCPVM